MRSILVKGIRMSLAGSKRSIKLHPKQGRAYRDTSRVTACSSGIQGGKTFVGAWKLRKAIEIDYPAKKYPDVAFIVAAPDHKTMVQSTRQCFDKIFYGLGTMHEMDQTFYLKDGRRIYFRTMCKNPWSCEGIQKVVFIWADEAFQYPRLAFINLQSRTAIMQGQLFLTSTPYGANWPRKDVIKKAQEGVEGFAYYEWLSVENPVFPREEYERQKTLLSRREFERKYMGIHSRMEGLIFEDWGEDNIISGQDVDLTEAYIVGGIDWGFAHSFALSIRAIQPDGQAYGISFFKGGGMSTSQVLDLIAAKTKGFGVKMWWAGHDRPDQILELNNRGIPCMKYFENHDEYREVDAGNQKLAEIIKTRQYKVFKEALGVDDLNDEYETYHWDITEDDEKASKPKPVNINDDLIAAERYVTVGCVERLTPRAEKTTLPVNYHVLHDTWRPGKSSKKKGWDAY